MTRFAEYIGTYPSGSPQWHKVRDSGIGGSEIAAVLGLSPWTSPFTLWHRKAGVLDVEQVTTQPMEWGNRLEPVVAEKFADEHPGWTVRKTGTWRSKTRPWQLANPDRLLTTAEGERAILEVKTAAQPYEWGPAGGDEIPIHYRCQVLWYLDVFGFNRCHLAVLIAGSDYREYVVDYSLTEAVTMRDEAAAFLHTVQHGQRPDLDESLSTHRTMRALHPDIDRGAEKEIPGELADTYLAAVAQAAAATTAKAGAATRVLDAIGDAQYAVAAGRRIARRVAIGNNPPHLRPLTPNTRRSA